jgi:hypothetical protein
MAWRQEGLQGLTPYFCDTFSDMEQVKRGPGRPATGQVPVRTVRVGSVWDEAHEIAKVRGEKFSDVIDSLLKRYVARHKT